MAEMETTERIWPGRLTAPEELVDWLVDAANALADAAKGGHWDEVLRLLSDDEKHLDANSWRPGRRSWFTPLHQAAWWGAPAEVVDELVQRGGWLTLRTNDGRTPAQIADERGHQHPVGGPEPADAQGCRT